ncbi:MAG: molybdopterin-dependent oxidoreductase [Chlorobi bacterium]|nr:MAG: Oxidoreductase molybdopterin binding domain protein [Chlorobi bacterium OLB7]MBK8911798.1 molybdopterin-dependent oxidoreductase [Chlorobiota bacterium]
MKLIPCIALLVLLGASIAEAQSLKIVGETVKDSLVLSLTELQSMPSDSVEVVHDGASHWFHGVRLNELLRRAGVPTGRSLRGDAMNLVMRLSAADGYRITLSLSELEPDFTNRTAIVAYRMGDGALSEKDGPLRLVISGEKRGARMIRQLTEIRIVRVE